MLTSMRLPEVRSDHVLLSYERDSARLSALLQLDRSDDAETVQVLRREGFVRDGSDAAWARPTGEQELEALCARLAAKLGSSAVWDVGHVFTNDVHPTPEGDPPPRTWPGLLLMHVCSTPRCLVFDRDADARDLGRLFEAQRAAYFARDFLPSE